MSDLIKSFGKLSFLLKEISPNDLKTLRESLELYLLEDDSVHRDFLLGKLGSYKGFNLQLHDEIQILRSPLKKSIIELKNIYNFHHEILIIDEIRPFYSKLLTSVQQASISDFENVLLLRIERLRNSVEENQKYFFSSIDRQLTYINKFENQPELLNSYKTFLRDQQRTYFSFIKTLTSEFKITIQLELANEYRILGDAEHQLSDPLLKQIDLLIEAMADMNKDMKAMNIKIGKMTEYINSKIDII